MTGLIKRKKEEEYGDQYFRKRDYLDPKIASAVENLATQNSFKTILDVGCGTGKLVKFLREKGIKAYGCDPFSIKRNSRIFTKASARKLPYQDNSFDLLTCISVVEHLKKAEMRRFLLEAKRVLKEDGSIFLVTPDYNSIWRFVLGKKWFGYSDPTHINFYTPGSLSSLLKRQGFEKIHHSFGVRNIGVLNWLLVSTWLWRIRDSFYVSARKI